MVAGGAVANFESYLDQNPCFSSLFFNQLDSIPETDKPPQNKTCSAATGEEYKKVRSSETPSPEIC